VCVDPILKPAFFQKVFSAPMRIFSASVRIFSASVRIFHFGTDADFSFFKKSASEYKKSAPILIFEKIKPFFFDN
jgi:hypothetical protein